MLFNGSSLSCTAGRPASSLKALKGCMRLPQLAHALQKAATEIREFAIDLLEALGTVHGQLGD